MSSLTYIYDGLKLLGYIKSGNKPGKRGGIYFEALDAKRNGLGRFGDRQSAQQAVYEASRIRMRRTKWPARSADSRSERRTALHT